MLCSSSAAPAMSLRLVLALALLSARAWAQDFGMAEAPADAADSFQATAAPQPTTRAIPAQVPWVNFAERGLEEVCSDTRKASFAAARQPASGRGHELSALCTPDPHSPAFLICKPSYLLVGFLKAGTASFFKYMQAHPGIYVKQRENHLFEHAHSGGADPELAKRLREMHRVDKSLMVDRLTGKITTMLGEHSGTAITSTQWQCENPGLRFCAGEHETDVGHVPRALRHVYAHEPQLLVLVRDPVDRAFSNYITYHVPYCRRDMDDPSTTVRDHAECFDILARAEVLRYQRCVGQQTSDTEKLIRCAFEPAEHPNYSRRIVTWSLYAVFLLNWQRHFPEERFCLVDLSTFASPEEGMAKVEACLGLEHYTGFKEAHYNRDRKPHEKMLPETRLFLERFFAPFNRLLARVNPDACALPWVQKSFERPPPE